MLRYGRVHRAGRTLDPLDRLLGAFGNAGAAAVALGVVDDGNVVLEEDRLVGAVAHAQTAGNAADTARLVDHGTLVLAGAFDGGLGSDGLHLDNMARAGDGAGGAAGTLGTVHHGDAVDHMDGVKLARAGAVAQTQTAESAGTGTARHGSRSGAGLDALIVKPLAAVDTAVADNGGAQAGAVVGIVAHNQVDGIVGLVAAGGALVGGGFALNDRLGVVGTAGVAAAAAVGTCQTFGDLGNARILVHGHKLGGQHQNDAACQTQHHQYDDS